jgi:hypothetical protein
MIGMKRNLKQTLETAETTADPRVKLQARANDCYRYIMDLCTNAGIVSDALKFVTHKKELLEHFAKDGRTNRRDGRREDDKRYLLIYVSNLIPGNQKHLNKPNLVTIERYNLKPQGKEWETVVTVN